MERLTEYILDNYDNVKEVLKKGNVLEIDLIRKLALFEDTCLEPSEIEQLKGKREVLWEKIDKLTAEVISAYRERDKFRAELEELKKNAIVPLNNITEKEVIEWLSKNCNKEGYFKRIYSIGTEQLDVKVHKMQIKSEEK